MFAYVRSAFDPDRQARSVLITAATIYAVFVLIASVIAGHQKFPPWPPGNPVRLLGFNRIAEVGLPNGGFAYIAKADDFSAFADTDSTAQKSPLVLYEN